MFMNSLGYSKNHMIQILKKKTEEKKTFWMGDQSNDNADAALKMANQDTEEACVICSEHKAKSSLYQFESCKHEFCRSCVEIYLIDRVNRHLPKVCPYCMSAVPRLEILQLLKKEHSDSMHALRVQELNAWRHEEDYPVWDQVAADSLKKCGVCKRNMDMIFSYQCCCTGYACPWCTNLEDRACHKCGAYCDRKYAKSSENQSYPYGATQLMQGASEGTLVVRTWITCIMSPETEGQHFGGGHQFFGDAFDGGF